MSHSIKSTLAFATSLALFTAALGVTSDAGADQKGKIKEEIAKVEAQIKSLTKPARWVMKTGSGEIASGKVHKLCNDQTGECLGWKKNPAGTGINLSWFPEPEDKQARLVKKGGGKIKYGDTIALFVGKTDDSYLCYASRPFGINLEWSTSPCYEWKIGGGAVGQDVKVGDSFTIRSLKENDEMVRCARKNTGFQGAWLKWEKTCSDAELVYTNKAILLQLTNRLKELKKKL
jgi:hypothetical protein